MSEFVFDPGKAMGDELLKKDRQELCLFVSRLCLQIKSEVGSRAYRGGVFPENICESETGELAIGPAKLEKWSGQELEFIAPELYWDGKTSPAADVYSLGLLLYYGLSGGKLPFASACSSGQLTRMGGKRITAPKAAGKRLGAILEKATAFQASDRYASPEELQVMLESCLDNKYLCGSSGAEAVFQKSDRELSDIERLMVGIMETGEEPSAEEAEEEPVEEAGEKSPEELAGLEKPEPKPAEEENVNALVEEFFGSLNEPENSSASEENASTPEEGEDVRVYEPSHDKKERTDRQPIPILTVEKYPELAPVVLEPQNWGSRAASDPEQQKVAEEVKKRRSSRPLAVVLGLCVLLVLGALIVNAVLKQNERSRQIAANAGNELPDPSAFYNEENGAVYVPDETQSSAPQENPSTPEAPTEPSYSVVASDMSWTEAQAACKEQGGHLAVISTRDEFDKITALAEEQGLIRLWIGCHRENDQLVWETNDEVNFTNWADNEPSHWDNWDGVPEDYVMIYREDGVWYYNDNRNDPASDYPEYYSGTMGYVIEFD